MWGKHKNSSTQMLKTWKPIQNNKSNKKMIHSSYKMVARFVSIIFIFFLDFYSYVAL